MPADISIITPWLDRPEFIADYERAVGAPGVEVIVVDNGSADANAALLRQMIQRLGGKYIRNEENRWFSAANNQGLAAATGSIIVFLNNDIAGDPIWLQGVRTDVKPDTLYGISVHEVKVDEKSIHYLEGWCLAARREVFQRLGGWDARAFSMPYFEDADLSMRAVSIGIKLAAINWPLIHKKNGTSGHVPGVAQAMGKNREMFAARVRGTAPPPPIAPKTPEEFAQTGRLAEGEVIYRQAIAKEPQKYQLWIDYGRLLNMAGRFEASLAALQRALELNPTSVYACFALGTLYVQTNRPREAAEVFRQLTDLAPDVPESWSNWSVALFDAGEFAQAAEAAQRALQLDPENFAGLTAHSKALRELGRLEEALADAQTAQQRHPKEAVSHQAAGLALMHMGRLEEARAALECSLAIDPHDGHTGIPYRKLMEQLKNQNAS